MTCSRFMRCHTLGPRLGEFPGLIRRRVSRSFLDAGCAYRPFGSLAPPSLRPFGLASEAALHERVGLQPLFLNLILLV
jgi:hypothetical protein